MLLLKPFFFSDMQIYSCILSLSILQWFPTVLRVPSNLLFWKGPALLLSSSCILLLFFLHYAFLPLCLLASLPYTPVTSYDLAQFLPRVSCTGKPFLISLLTLKYADLSEILFFTPVSSHRVLHLFLSQHSSHSVIMICLMSISGLTGSFLRPRSLLHFYSSCYSTKPGPQWMISKCGLDK